MGRTAPGRYAVGMFGTSLPINMFLTFMAIYYIDTLGMPVQAYSAVLAVYAVIDALDNPLYGFLSDRTRTRWGRRRPWLVVATPVLGVSFVLFFSPPNLSDTGLIAWFAVFTVLTGTSDSMVNANYGALLPELFPQEKHRAVANSLRQGFQLVAMILSIAMVPLAADYLGYSLTALVLAIVAVAVILWCATGAREDPQAARASTPRLLDTAKTIVTHRKFWLIALTAGAYSSGMTLVLAAVAFFVKYTLDLPGAAATYLLASVIGISALALVLWTRWVRRFGPEPVWRVALSVLAVGLALMSLASGLATAIAIGALVGFGYSGVMATMDLIVARLLDEDMARTGHRREGMFLAAFGFFNRLDAWVKSLAFLAVAALFGYQSGDSPGPHPEIAAQFLLSVFPAVLVGMAAVLSFFVRFDRSMVERARAGAHGGASGEGPQTDSAEASAVDRGRRHGSGGPGGPRDASDSDGSGGSGGPRDALDSEDPENPDGSDDAAAARP